MKGASNHPTRAAMIRAIQSGDIPFAEHLERCPVCRNQFGLLKRFPVSGYPPIAAPDKHGVERYAAIPLVYGKITPSRLRAGKISYDSWSRVPAMQLRDIGPGATRHLRLTAGTTTLELVAERQQDRWEFTARVYYGKEVMARWALYAGGRKLLPRSLGFYHWSSRHRPRIIRLMTRYEMIQFERLPWE